MTELSESSVKETLLERVTKDCDSALKHLSLIDVVGCLETIKIGLLIGQYAVMSNEISNAFKGEMTEQ